MYQKIDQDSMFDAIWEFPNNHSDALELGQNINLSNDYINITIKKLNRDIPKDNILKKTKNIHLNLNQIIPKKNILI